MNIITLFLLYTYFWNCSLFNVVVVVAVVMIMMMTVIIIIIIIIYGCVCGKGLKTSKTAN